MKKPIIGIVSKQYMHADYDQFALERTFVINNIKDSVLDHGGVPIGLFSPQVGTVGKIVGGGDSDFSHGLTGQEIQNLTAQLELCDGVLFPGYTHTFGYEYFVAKYCFDNDIPTLGICAGQNVMARATGGSTKLVQNPEKHDQEIWENRCHPIIVKPGTMFHKITGTEKFQINSIHQNVVDVVPPNHIASAHDDDGNIEVIEATNKKFFLATRFHPEALYKKCSHCSNIFTHFVKSAKAAKVKES